MESTAGIAGMIARLFCMFRLIFPSAQGWMVGWSIYRIGFSSVLPNAYLRHSFVFFCVLFLRMASAACINIVQ